jgi:hypothetical protein
VWLIVSEPINQVYLRVYNPLLSKINFKLIDPSGNIGLRGETILICIYAHGMSDLDLGLNVDLINSYEINSYKPLTSTLTFDLDILYKCYD